MWESILCSINESVIAIVKKTFRAGPENNVGTFFKYCLILGIAFKTYICSFHK